MKRLFHFVFLALLLSSVTVLHGSEPRRTLWKYLLFFNSGYKGTLEDFRACFVPEERERIIALPRQQPGVSNNDLDILEELKSSSRCEYRYRLGPDDSVYILVLENRNGAWLVNSALTEELQQRRLQQSGDVPGKTSAGRGSAEPRKTSPAATEDRREPARVQQPEQRREPARVQQPEQHREPAPPALPTVKPVQDSKSWIRNRNTRTVVQRRNGSVRLGNQKRPGPESAEPGNDPLADLKLPPMSSRWQRGISGWELHYAAALTKARQEKKMIFALNTGSDWCGWCVKLRKEVLQSSEFKRFARRHLVLLYLDSPKKNPLPPDQNQHNQLVRQKLGLGGGVPTAVIVNPDGQVVARKVGYSPLHAYMAFLKQQVK